MEHLPFLVRVHFLSCFRTYMHHYLLLQNIVEEAKYAAAEVQYFLDFIRKR